MHCQFCGKKRSGKLEDKGSKAEFVCDTCHGKTVFTIRKKGKLWKFEVMS
jgi:transcription elongation factor Elf1